MIVQFSLHLCTCNPSKLKLYWTSCAMYVFNILFHVFVHSLCSFLPGVAPPLLSFLIHTSKDDLAFLCVTVALCPAYSIAILHCILVICLHSYLFHRPSSLRSETLYCLAQYMTLKRLLVIVLWCEGESRLVGMN